MAGAALSAPLLLPGLQLLGLSGRTFDRKLRLGNRARPRRPAAHLPGVRRTPRGRQPLVGSVSYQWTANYVGVITLVMAVVALGIRWKRPEVIGLGALVAVMAVLALVPKVASALNGLPVIGNVILARALVPLAFGLSVLAGIGLDALVREPASARVRRWAGWGFGGAAIVLLAIWLFDRGHLPADEARIRSWSFLWPAIAVLVGLAVVAWITWTVRHHPGPFPARRAHVAVGLLLLCETAFLVAAARQCGPRARRFRRRLRRWCRSKRRWEPRSSA